MIAALEVYRSVPRYALGRVATGVSGSRAAGRTAGRLAGAVSDRAAPVRLVDRVAPELPARPGWARVRPLLAGICGSDLATLSGSTSLYFSPLVSMPFVPGHEVVGELLDACGDLPVGCRVVLDPVLACAARSVPPCRSCAEGQTGRCDSVTVGHLAPGLQTGFCRDTGGGWSGELVAHRSQLHAVPDDLPDERAVLVEPLACAVHTALRARTRPRDSVLVVGAGAVGLLTLLALRTLGLADDVTVVARHPRQAELARSFGASAVLRPDDAVAGVRRRTRAMRARPVAGGDFLLGGADVALDCAGSRQSLDTVLRSTRAGGRVVLAGIPAPGADLTPVWFRELEVVGSYASATETVDGGRQSAFTLALELARTPALAAAEPSTHPLAQWREALDHASSAGRLGTVKVAFDLRQRARRRTAAGAVAARPVASAPAEPAPTASERPVEPAGSTP